jgi:hypothetical protein
MAPHRPVGRSAAQPLARYVRRAAGDGAVGVLDPGGEPLAVAQELRHSVELCVCPAGSDVGVVNGGHRKVCPAHHRELTVVHVGDPVAVSIWQGAVSDLADTAVAACDALPPADQRIAVTGSLFELTDLVTDPFTVTMTARKPGVTVRRAAGDALTGAALMAERPADRYETLVFRSAMKRVDRLE